MDPLRPHPHRRAGVQGGSTRQQKVRKAGETLDGTEERLALGREAYKETRKRRTDAGGPPIPAGGRRNDIIAIVVGTILYLALGFVFHPIVIGVPAFGTPAMGN